MGGQTSGVQYSDNDQEVLRQVVSEFGDQGTLKLSRKFEDYLGGTLRFIEIETDSSLVKRYCLSTRREDLWFASVEELLQWSAGKKYDMRFRDLDFGQAVTGAIAIIVVVVIGYWAVFIGKDPPGYLGTALTTILGFYFGRASKQD